MCGGGRVSFTRLIKKIYNLLLIRGGKGSLQGTRGRGDYLFLKSFGTGKAGFLPLDSAYITLFGIKIFGYRDIFLEFP